jgi:Ca2+-binding EF-hand superfamily protein
MYMFAAGAATSAIGALASLKDLFKSSSGSPTDAQAGTAPFAVGQTPAGSTPPATGANWKFMTTETMTMMISVQSEATAAGTQAHGGGRASQYFAMLDTNRDGSVSKDELSAALTPSGNADKTDALFTKLDTDNDGSVSLDELRSAIRESRHRHRHVGNEDAASNDIDNPPQGTTSKTVTNTDGSSTTTISYEDGSSVSMTRPAAAAANANGSVNNLLERLIQRQAQALAASTSGQALSVSA